MNQIIKITNKLNGHKTECHLNKLYKNVKKNHQNTIYEYTNTYEQIWYKPYFDM